MITAMYAAKSMYSFDINAPKRMEPGELLNIEIGCNLTGIKCCSLTSPNSVWRVTYKGGKVVLEIKCSLVTSPDSMLSVISDVFLYEGKWTLKIKPISYRKDPSTEKIDLWYGADSA